MQEVVFLEKCILFELFGAKKSCPVDSISESIVTLESAHVPRDQS